MGVGCRLCAGYLMALCLLTASPGLLALDLMTAWKVATQASPWLDAAEQNYLIAEADAAVSRSKLLPNLRWSLYEGKNENRREMDGAISSFVKQDYRSSRKQLSLTQPLFRPVDYFSWRQAKAEQWFAKGKQGIERLNLAYRTTKAYLDLLAAVSRHQVHQARTAELRKILDHARKALVSGVGTRTDLHDAQAELDVGQAEEIESAYMVEVAENQLSEILGVPVNSASISPIDPDGFEQLPLEKRSLESWLALAAENNTELAGFKHKIKALEDQISAQRAAHAPTVDLVVSKSDSLSDTESTIGNRNKTDAIGLQLNLPLFAGGSGLAMENKALAQFGVATAEMEIERRRLKKAISAELRRLDFFPSKILALQTASRSTGEALLGNKKGLQAGTRTLLDVLEAERQLAINRREAGQAQIEYFDAYAKFHMLFGGLDDEVIEKISRQLQLQAPRGYRLENGNGKWAGGRD